MECVKCGSNKVEKRRHGAAVGYTAGIAAAGCYAASKYGSEKSDSGIAGIVFSLLGIVLGGVVAGTMSDGIVFDNYKCNDCGHTFKDGEDPLDRVAKAAANTVK